MRVCVCGVKCEGGYAHLLNTEQASSWVHFNSERDISKNLLDMSTNIISSRHLQYNAIHVLYLTLTVTFNF